ncbi:LRRN4 C-terminal-like protein [Clarias gariepinus]|uniref:leucine-rich repeat neuronal protein 4 n=1 Tax=Clarias gariepinus TaxID=13013 RepID=UPI00234DACFA|nr:leucine-rich repeat neuronal protein 4 [Clarias gariepinus]
MLGKHAVPKLLLSITLLISSMLMPSSSSSSTTHNASSRPGVLNPHLNGHNENYDDNSEETDGTTTSPDVSPPQFCEYDACKDQQEPCQKLRLTLFCSCPGISGPFDPPDPPSLSSLSIEMGGTVVVRWCAPSSTITHYLIRVEGQDGAHEVAENRRMMELGNIAPGTEVCVEAVNKAGVSPRQHHSCSRFEPRSSEERLTVKLVLIGAAVVVVLAIALALVLWWCMRRRKTPARTANRGTDMVL